LANWKKFALAALFAAIVFYGGAIWMGIRIAKQKPGVPINTFATFAVGDPMPQLRFEITASEKKDDIDSFRGKPVLVYFYNLGDTELAARLAAKHTVLALSDEKRYAILKDLLGKPQPFVSARVTQSDIRSQFPWLRQGQRPRAVLIDAEGRIARFFETRSALEQFAN
jgi:peroxiredoxin